MTDVLISPQLTEPDTEDEIVAHIVRKEDQMRGYVFGEEVEALCGKKWVPSRDFEGKSVCEPCKQVMLHIQGAGSN